MRALDRCLRKWSIIGELPKGWIISTDAKGEFYGHLPSNVRDIMYKKLVTGDTRSSMVGEYEDLLQETVELTTLLFDSLLTVRNLSFVHSQQPLSDVLIAKAPEPAEKDKEDDKDKKDVTAEPLPVVSLSSASQEFQISEDINKRVAKLLDVKSKYHKAVKTGLTNNAEGYSSDGTFKGKLESFSSRVASEETALQNRLQFLYNEGFHVPGFKGIRHARKPPPIMPTIVAPLPANGAN